MKKNLYLIFVNCFVLLLSFSCSTDDDIPVSDFYGDFPNDSNSIKSGDDIEFLRAKLRINKEVFSELDKNRINNISKGDSYKINYIKRVGDFIQVNLSYSGGCKQHNFEVIWDGIVYTDNPCHMNLMLLHDANGDNCEAYITETVVINLNALVGEIDHKDSCSYYIWSTYNSGENADAIVKGIN